MNADLSFAFPNRRDNASSDMGIDRDLPRVVQVGQVWGDTLLDVRHLGPDEPRLRLGGEPRSGRPLGTAAGMAPLLLGAGVGLATGQATLLAAGAAVSALGLSGGMLRDEIRMGRGEDCMAVPAELLPSTTFTLIERQGRAVYLRIAEGFCGSLTPGEGEPAVDLRDWIESGHGEEVADGFRVELPAGAKAIVQVGELQFFVRQVHQAARVVPGLADSFDGAFLGLLLLVAFAGLVLGVLARSAPYDPSHELVSVDKRFAEIAYMPEPPPPPRKELAGDQDAGEGERAKDEEGKVGTRDSTVKKAKGAKVAVRQAAMDKRIAENAGLLVDLSRMESDAPMFGSGGIGVGASAFVGGEIGSQYGNQYGSGGLGFRGSMDGGGGTGEYLGGLGNRYRERGGSGDGSQGGWYGRKKSGAPPGGSGADILIGALEKSQIDRVVKAHLAQVRWCYQRELRANPKLEGKVVVKFVIDASGGVSRATVHASSLGNPIVENCICERFMAFQFPKPKGGGMVIVTYPFYFHST